VFLASILAVYVTLARWTWWTWRRSASRRGATRSAQGRRRARSRRGEAGRR
jgi:hypothetical protein